MQEIIDRITKLLALSMSPNEFEASAAAAKAQEILTEHNLIPILDEAALK